MRSRTSWAFAGILAVAVVLRLWGTGFGEHSPLARPDEQIYALEAMGMFVRPYARLATGWPQGFFTLWHAVLRGQLLFRGDTNLPCLLALHPLAVLLPMRVVSALLGAATALVVGRVGARLGGERAGVLAAAIYAVNYLVGRDAHFAASDSALCLGVALCLLACARAAEGDAKAFVAAGLLFGATFGVKYSALALAAPCLIAAWPHRRDQRALLLFAALGIIAFTFASPRALEDGAEFWSGITGHGALYEDTASGPIESTRGALHYPLVVLPAAFGWAGFALAICGLVVVLLQRKPAGIVAGGYAVLFFAVVLAPLGFAFARYASPLIPALAACAGVGGVALANRFDELIYLRVRRLPVALIAIALAATLPPALRLAQFDRLLARTDTRDLAQRWMEENAPGASVESFGGWAHVQVLEPAALSACATALKAEVPVAAPTLAARTKGWGELIARGRSAWETLGQRLLARSLDDRKGKASHILYARGPWPIGDQGASMGRPDPRCWSQAASFSPGHPAGEYDVYDGFHMPFTSFAGAERPGPEVTIFARRPECR